MQGLPFGTTMLLGLTVVVLGSFVSYYTTVPKKPVFETGDVLNFVGTMIGAIVGIVAVFLAVQLQAASEEKRRVRTMFSLIVRLQSAAEIMLERAATCSPELVRGVFRAMTAAMDTAEAIRSTNAGIATVASHIRHTSVWPEIERLRTSPGIAQADMEARAKEVILLCDNLYSHLKLR